MTYKMKKLILGLFVIGTLFSCTEQKGYKIEGSTTAEMENDKVFLIVNDTESDGIKVIDSTEVKGNSFVFKGGEVKPEIATISIQKSEDARPVYLNVVLQNGNIKVKIDSVLTISGTPLNDS